MSEKQRKLISKCEKLIKRKLFADVLLEIEKYPELKSAIYLDKSLLFLAWYHESGMEFFEQLLKAGVSPNLQDTSGSTLLIDACGAGNIKLAELLLKYGADVNKETSNGETAFSFCCANNNLKIAKLLYKHGADINKKNVISGAAPLDWAIKFSSKKFVEWLISIGGIKSNNA